MNWYKPLESIEIVLAGLFLLFYMLYLIRVIRVANALNTGFYAVFYKILLRTVYFALIIIALLGPSFGESSKEIRSIGKDIYIAVDLSESMNAFDIQPTRLEKLKFELKNIVESFNSDRIGLIIFSSEAFVQCPLTYDQSALHLFIEGLSTHLVPNTGTDFGPPLRMALVKLEDDESLVTQQKSKIIIMISDGEDFGDDTESIASEVENSGIKLFTLGIGTNKGSKIMTRRGFKKKQDGTDVISKLNPVSLKSLALKSGGKYFEINESKNDVTRLINTIGLVEGELRESRKLDVSDNKYYYFLGLALFLIVLDILIGFKTIRI